MKITHRNPSASWWQVPVSDPVEPAFEDQVRACTEHSEREYQAREARLHRAETRLARVRTQRKPKLKLLRSLEALVELRRAELEEYRRLMMAAPASAEHRGDKSFRPVPPVQGIPL